MVPRATLPDTFTRCPLTGRVCSLSIRHAEGDDEHLRLHLWGIVEEVHIERLHDREALIASMVETVPFHELRLEMKPAPHLAWSSIAPDFRA